MDDEPLSISVGDGYLLRLTSQDLPIYEGQRWRLWRRVTVSGRVYVYMLSAEKAKGEPLHRAILGAGRGQVVDHIDGDGLNNVRSNLRLCTAGENMRNRRINANHKHGHKGVQLRPSGLYCSQIRAGGTRRFKGGFATAEEAAAWYAAAALELHGQFARLK